MVRWAGVEDDLIAMTVVAVLSGFVTMLPRSILMPSREWSELQTLRRGCVLAEVMPGRYHQSAPHPSLGHVASATSQ